MIKFGHKGKIVEIIPEELAMQLVYANSPNNVADLLRCLRERYLLERYSKSDEQSAILTRITLSLEEIVKDMRKLK